MKLNCLCNFLYGLKGYQRYASDPSLKIVRVAKLVVLIIVTLSFQLSAKSFSQSITLSTKNTSLVSVLREIRKQSGYKLIYNTDLLEKARPVSVVIKNASINEALDKVMNDQPMDYEIENETILIQPKRPHTTTETSHNPQQVVTGRVLDEGKLPLPGAIIHEKDTRNQVVSNDKGEFKITVSRSGAILVISYIGFIAREIPASGTNLEVVLKSKENSLNQVVITGFQKVDAKKFTGSVSQVDLKTIDRSGSIDVSRMLQGAAAGVSVQNVSGTFGATPKIRIRGNASISANQEPLYVVNGVPITTPSSVSVSQLYSGDPASLLGSAIAGLNAQDIEDIVILKDGSATSLYGTRAANGVISITTKSGKKNQRNINYSTALSYGIKPKIKDFNVMDSYQEMDFYNELYSRGYFANSNWPSSTGAFTETYRQYALRDINLEQAYTELDRSAKANTDWFDVLFKNNLVQEHNLSFSGGGEKNTYYLSGSYAKDNGQAMGFNMDRFTTDFRSVFNLTPKVDLDLDLNWNMRHQATPGTLNSETSYSEVNRAFEINPTLYAMNTSRSMYPYNPDGSYKYYLNNYAPFNIIEELNENFTKLKVQTVQLMVKPTVKIFPFLTYQGIVSVRKSSVGYDHVMTERSNAANAYRVDYNDVLRTANTLLYKDPTDPLSVAESILPKGGFIYARNNTNDYYYIRNMLSFNQTWTKHSLSAAGGMDVSSDRTDYKYTKGIGYMYYGGKIISPSTLAYKQSVQKDDRLYMESFVNKTMVGYYSNFQYSYLSRYNMEGGMRLDASNMFGKLNRSKFLPSYNLGLSWNVDREPFLIALNSAQKIDYLKLRASYALRGNAYEGSPSRNALYINRTRLDEENSEVGINVSSPELFNLNWEKDYISNFGVDLGLFGRLSLTAEYYSRKNKNLVNSVNVAQEEGFTTKTINFASMTNEGVDLMLGMKDILNQRNLKWDVNFIYGYTKNKVEKGELESALLSQITRSTGYPLNGYPLEGIYAYRFNGLNQDGRPTFLRGDQVMNGIITSEKDRSLVEFLGTRQPTTTGSVSSNISYKGFDFRVFLTYAMGHKVFMSPIAQRSYIDNMSTSGDLAYRWGASGDENFTNIPGLLSSIQRTYLATVSNMDEIAYNRSDFRVASGNNLRLSELMFSYDFDKKFLRKLEAVKNVRLTLSANNVYYWASKKLRGVDPDLLLAGGVALPNPRSYSLRLSVGL